MTPFTDLEAAIEEAQYIANQVRGNSQRRSAYIVQKGHVMNVLRYEPRNKPIMLKVEPESDSSPKYLHKPNQVVGVSRHKGMWVANFMRKGKKMKQTTHKDWFEAVCARKSAEARYL
jgi:type III secretory pathway component EscU